MLNNARINKINFFHSKNFPFHPQKGDGGCKEKSSSPQKIRTANTGDTKGKRGKSTEYDGSEMASTAETLP